MGTSWNGRNPPNQGRYQVPYRYYLCKHIFSFMYVTGILASRNWVYGATKAPLCGCLRIDTDILYPWPVLCLVCRNTYCGHCRLIIVWLMASRDVYYSYGYGDGLH